ETGNSGLQAAIIAIDSASGEILFLHGGDEFSSSNQFNRAIQMRRQTGSSIKPVLYAASIDLGLIHAGSRILDAPLLYRGMQGHQNWAPDNIGMSYDGEISVREALVKSKNTAAVQVAERIGSANIEKYFSAYFFPEKKESEKRFGSFSNDGIIRRPFLIKKITNSSGNVIYEYKDQDEFHLKIPEQRRVISPETAEVMVSILKGSANASGIRASGYKGEVAGKTGTTNDYKDAWFIGTRPGISMAVWIGYDDPAYGLGSRGMGAVLAAPLWARLGNRAEELALLSHDKFSFSKRAISKSICRESGDLSSESCPHPVNELFTPSGIPGKICSLKHIKSSRRELLKNIF
ncbi:MAG: carboxypeptidase, partial [Leptospira sp.]|nr:carboxypeptidase [Leptospira sp.]